MRTSPALLAACGLLLGACQGQTTAPPTGATTTEGDVRAFIADLEHRYTPLFIQANQAWWEASLTGSDEAFARRQQADNAINALFADRAAFARIQGWLASGQPSDPLLRRQLQVLQREHLPRQVDPALLERMVKLGAEVEQIFNTHRSAVGGQQLTENEVRRILASTRDSAQARAAWEAYMAVGAKVEAKLKELVALRNQSARALGFASYYDLALAGQELDATRLLAIFDELDRLTAAPFAQAKAAVDAALAAKFKVAPAALRHWHYQDLFFQEAPPIYELDLDELFAGVKLEELASRYYGGLGLEVGDILARGDLYEKPGKSPHAFCINMDRAGDVRILTNLASDARWADTLLHELGHGVYDKYLDGSLPFLLREPAHILTTEGVAMLFGRMAKNPAWLEQALGLAPDKARAAGAVAQKTMRLEALTFSRWAQVMVRFEQGLYANPDQDLAALWNGLKLRYQGITPAEGRGAPDYAAKIHIVAAPVYYHNYQLGALFASQVHRHVAQRVLAGADPATASYVGRPEVGAYFKQKIFAPAARLPWEELVQQATGAALSPAAFAADFIGT